MLKCRKCAAHEIEIPVRGHARLCPYRLCSCDKCLKVVSKRLSSVKRRYKNSDVVFVNVECNSGNVRVQAIPKSIVDTIKSNEITKNPSSSSTVSIIPSNSPNCQEINNIEKEKSTVTPSNDIKSTNFMNIETLLKPENYYNSVPNIFNMINYLKMQPEQQLNFLSTYAWILQTTQFLKNNDE